MPAIRLSMVAALFALLLLACSIEEDLTINSDGSGTYRVRVSVPKTLGNLDELRQNAEKDGFTIVEQGESENERFIVIRKEFTNVSELNGSQGGSFELTMTEAGFLRREYRLRAALQTIGYGGFKRRLIVTMPREVQSATAARPEANRVVWEGAGGGTIEVVASGFYVPLTRNQKRAMWVIAAAGAVLIFALRRRRASAAPAPLSQT